MASALGRRRMKDRVSDSSVQQVEGKVSQVRKRRSVSGRWRSSLILQEGLSNIGCSRLPGDPK